MKRRGVRRCPCGGESYRSCCQPYHRGATPEDPERLLRTRFSAFALGEWAYLGATVHPDHPDYGVPTEELTDALRGTTESQRFMGLELHDARVGEDKAQLLYTVRVFVRGKDRSFTELGDFARAEGAWRYVAGSTFRPEEAPRAIADGEPSGN